MSGNGRGVFFLSFFLLHSINACNHLLVTNAQIYSRSLFVFVLFCTCRFSSFILPVYTATEFGRRLGFAVPLLVAIVNLPSPIYRSNACEIVPNFA
uniref:Secreted protein n=1 Tax=Rhipicephalus appendiculatus TaxID=34631 RepID=A0A131YBY1_RHIAP